MSAIYEMSVPQMLAMITGFNACYFFGGHGTKGQFADVNAAYEPLAGLVARFDELHGAGHWLAIYGGDRYVESAPDIAHIARRLSLHHRVPLLAIESDVAREWGIDDYVSAVNFTPTTRNEKGAVVWGGEFQGRMVGPTYALWEDVFPTGRLKGVVAIGGGPLAHFEIRTAFERGIRVFYLPALARNPEVNGPYGSFHDEILRSDNPLLEILATAVRPAL